MANQSRETIAKQLTEFSRATSPYDYQYFLLELLLDVLVDIRDRLDKEDVKELPPST